LKKWISIAWPEFSPRYARVLSQARKRWPAIAAAAEHPFAEWLALEGTERRNWPAELWALFQKILLVLVVPPVCILIHKKYPFLINIEMYAFPLVAASIFSLKSDPGRIFRLSKGIEVRPENASDICLLPVSYSTVLAGIVLNSLVRKSLAALCSGILFAISILLWIVFFQHVYHKPLQSMLPGIIAIVLCIIATPRIGENIRVTMALREAGDGSWAGSGAWSGNLMAISGAGLIFISSGWWAWGFLVFLIPMLFSNYKQDQQIEKAFTDAVAQQELYYLVTTKARLEQVAAEPGIKDMISCTRATVGLYLARLKARWDNFLAESPKGLNEQAQSTSSADTDALRGQRTPLLSPSSSPTVSGGDESFQPGRAPRMPSPPPAHLRQ